MFGRGATACVLVVLLVLVVSGCTASSDTKTDTGETVTVPDVTTLDGGEAGSEIEDVGLVAVLTGTDSEPSLDPGRDPSGCTVDGQDPSPGADASPDDEITLTVDCRQVDWENQAGDVWDAFSSSFTDGFTDGCGALFDLSPDGSLYESDTEYTVTDCENLEPSDAADEGDLPTDVPDDPETDGYDLGVQSGCNALFDDEGIDALFYGNDAYNAEDCAAQAQPAETDESRKPPSESRGDDESTGPCEHQAEVEGDIVGINRDKGTVDCEGAIALWRQYVRRAPTEGHGSGGAITMDGWTCVSARPPELPKLGACSNADGSEFSVREEDAE